MDIVGLYKYQLLNMIVNDQFYRFYRPYLNKIHQSVLKGGVSIFVGINSSGKTLFKEQIFSKKFRDEFIKEKKIHFVFLDFKDKIPSSSEQLYKYWLSETAKSIGKNIIFEKEINEYDFNTQMNEWVQSLKKDEQIAYVLLDVQNIINIPESFFTSLSYLYIYSYGKISTVLLSEPHILECKNPSLERFIQRFTKHKYIFLKPFDGLTALADIEKQSLLLKTDFSDHNSLILRYAKGLHGVIRTFCYLLKDNPDINSIRQLMKIAYDDKLCQFWVNEVLKSLPSQSVRILKEVSISKDSFRKYKKSRYGDWLIKLGFLRKNGSFRHPLIIPFLNQYSVFQNETKRQLMLQNNQFYFQGEKIDLTKNEKDVLEILYKSKGRLVTYDLLAEKLWPNQQDKFSLWAISQIIRRLRKKFTYYSINPKIISSQRGEGYILN